MLPAIISLPTTFEEAIRAVLAQEESAAWVHRALVLHERYVAHTKDTVYIQDILDAMAYLAMRVPATYAQTLSALAAVSEMIPSWHPQSVLDIGGGPGTAVWAARELWPGITTAISLDTNQDLQMFGHKILSATNHEAVTWQRQDVRRGLAGGPYDLIVIGNVLNELHPAEREKLIGQAFNQCSGVLVIIESGTPFGSGVVSSMAKKLQYAGELLAPYIDNSFIQVPDFWLHFHQRFIRPEFSRRIRQHMRSDSTMASDWEDAKYSYVGISNVQPDIHPWGRVSGPVSIEKGFLEVPVLTKDGIEVYKVMKRDKEQFARAKRMKWGELIFQSL